MLFTERKTLGGYEYCCEDVFGMVHIESPEKLGREALDLCVMAVLNGKARRGTIGGLAAGRARAAGKSTLRSLESVTYRYDPAPVWEDDELDAEQRDRVQHRQWLDALRARIRRAVLWVLSYAGI